MFFSMIVPGLALLALMVSFPVSAGAAGDSGGDAKLQAMRSDLQACMQSGDAGKKAREAFAKKYNVPLSKLNENVPSQPPASNGGWDRVTSYWVCTAEYATVVGCAIWDARQLLEGVNCGGTIYCVNYSMHLDHWNWQMGKLKEKMSDVCAKH